ncbi:MAG: hypothetical protein P4L98_22565 [Ancalomicrobiaceae bacterium]|nr:hypothetical protein [Ancalomicrobiaceae bacterium]
MEKRFDLTLVVLIALVWLALAVVYQVSPSLGMPGYVRVWGVGALVFLGLAGAIAVIGRRS